MPLKVEFELEKAPEDGITCVEFCPAPGSPLLLCSSWDCCLRLYDVQSNQLKANIQHPVRRASELTPSIHLSLSLSLPFWIAASVIPATRSAAVWTDVSCTLTCPLSSVAA